MSRFRKMATPRANRAHSLWRGCRFAFCAGWEKGYREDGTQDDSAVEDQFRQRGRWVGSLDENNYVELDMGRALDEGLSDDRIEWTDNGFYDGNPNFLSAVVLVRPDSVQNSEQAIFNKQDGPVPNSGWGITVSYGGDPNPNGYHFQINTGSVNEFSVTNTQNTSRSDVIVMIYNGASLLGYQNGSLIGEIGASGSINLNNDPVALFGDGVQPNFQGSAGMAAFWDRPLSNSEIAQLNSDPYIMWRIGLHKEFMFGPGAFGGFQTFFLNFG